MRRRVVLLVAALTTLAVTGASDAVAAAPGSIALPGLPRAWWTLAADINDAGVVTGTSAGTPVRWDAAGRITALPVPPGLSAAYADEITDSGFITGEAQREDNQGGIRHDALLWDPKGRLTELGHLRGSPDTQATDVNESGTVVGFATGTDGMEHAVRWDSDGRTTALPVLRGGTYSSAAAVNDKGVAAGYSDVVIRGEHVTHAVKWDPAGRIMDLGGPTSATTSYAVDINNAGMTAGGLGGTLARWNHLGRVTVLRTPPEFSSIWPVLINDDGVVVGVGQKNETAQQHAVRWDRQGRVTTLDAVGYPTTWVNGINRAGVIVGTSQHGRPHRGTTRDSQATMWNPVGEATVLGPPAGERNEATSINDHGGVCGTSGNLDGSNTHAVRWYRWPGASTGTREV